MQEKVVDAFDSNLDVLRYQSLNKNFSILVSLLFNKR